MTRAREVGGASVAACRLLVLAAAVAGLWLVCWLTSGQAEAASDDGDPLVARTLKSVGAGVVGGPVSQVAKAVVSPGSAAPVARSGRAGGPAAGAGEPVGRPARPAAGVVGSAEPVVPALGGVVSPVRATAAAGGGVRSAEPGARAVGAIASPATSGVAEVVEPVARGVGAAVSPVGGTVAAVAKPVAGVVRSAEPLARAVVSPVVATVATVAAPVAGVVRSVEPVARTVVSPVVETAGSVLAPVLRSTAPVLAPVTGAAKSLLSPLTSTVTTVAKPIVGALTGVVKPVTGATAPVLEDLLPGGVERPVVAPVADGAGRPGDGSVLRPVSPLVVAAPPPVQRLAFTSALDKAPVAPGHTCAAAAEAQRHSGGHRSQSTPARPGTPAAPAPAPGSSCEVAAGSGAGVPPAFLTAGHGPHRFRASPWAHGDFVPLWRSCEPGTGPG